MTNKDTERLVRGHMQQTIPDKDALWNKIESNLPAQPEMPRIRKSSGRHITRIIGAAACFLLVIGGVGVWSALGGGHFAARNETMMPDQADVANEDACADAAPEEHKSADYAEGERSADEAPASPQQGFANSSTSGIKSEAEETREFADADVNAGIADAAPQEDGSLTLTGHVHGEPVTINADLAVQSEAEAIIAENLQLQETVNTETLGRARNEGVLLTFRPGSEEITLLALDGEYRMIAGGRVYPASASAQQLLKSLE